MVLELKDRSWFKDIFNDNYDYIRNYLFYLSGDIEIAEDIAQDVFLKIWEKREIVKEDTLKALIFRIARNMYFNSHKRKNLDLKFMKEAVQGNLHESPEYELEVKEFDQRLQSAIGKLPEHCRTIFLMSRMDDLKNQEIANSFGISVKAVEKQITKALKMLREELGYKI